MIADGVTKIEFADLCSEGETSGPASSADIDAAQNELGVIFPMEYREFLETYGAAILPGAEIYGLPDQRADDPPLWSNVSTVTKSLRDVNQSGAADRHFVPISEDGTGVFFYLNTRASPATEVWAVGPGVSKLVSDNLFEFFIGLCERRSFTE